MTRNQISVSLSKGGGNENLMLVNFSTGGVFIPGTTNKIEFNDSDEMVIITEIKSSARVKTYKGYDEVSSMTFHTDEDLFATDNYDL